MSDAGRRSHCAVSAIVLAGAIAASLVTAAARAEAHPHCQSIQNHPTYGTFYDCMTIAQPPGCDIYYTQVRSRATPIGTLWYSINFLGTCRHGHASLTGWSGSGYWNLWTERNNAYPEGNTVGLPVTQVSATQLFARILNDRNMTSRSALVQYLGGPVYYTSWY